MRRVFVIRPFEKKKDSSGKELDFERVHRELIGPALEAAASFQGSTTGEIVEAGNIREDMFSLILEADLVVCDITIHNANVFYELGIRHALRKNRTLLIRGEPTSDKTPFDLLTDRYLRYQIDDPAASRDDLVAAIQATIYGDRRTDSPVFEMLPTLPEADPATVQAVPLDFREEVERARSSNAKGWLRLLAQEVRTQRFQWPGLQIVADAQWATKDYEGARESLEAIRAARGDSPAANLALANVYERLHRLLRKAELLRESDQAIERVLASPEVKPRDRVEALALKGRNSKTRWRRSFEEHDTLDGRRATAMNAALRESYEAYRAAFNQDLNHFYSGIAALQMGTIFLELSAGGDAWKLSFNDDGEADAYRAKVARDIARLPVLVADSAEAATGRKDADYVWARITSADVLFLTEPSVERVVKRYKDVVPADKDFKWDAVGGQLDLFAALGIKAELARRVIAEVGREEAREGKPSHVVVFAGHRVDASGRKPPRFPPEKEARARELIREALIGLAEGFRADGMASAAPGADILFHEICGELGIPSVLCLPMRASGYAAKAFEDLDDWRTRFLNLKEEHQGKKKREILELGEFGDGEPLPRWLLNTRTDPWERGNRWVLQMALASGARKVTVLALWDGKADGDAPGGTAHMVEIARRAGTVDVKIIDAAKLLA